MVQIYCTGADLIRRVVERLPAGWSWQVVPVWSAFQKAFPATECGVLVASAPRPSLFTRIRILKQQHPGHPLVLVTSRNRVVLRRLRDRFLDEVVWMRELGSLAHMVQRAWAEGRFRHMARRVRACGDLPLPLVDALTHALLDRPPPTTVETLAEEVGRDRRTLWYHLRDATGDAPDLTLKSFLDWVLLLRAVALKADGTTWKAVADELDVRPRTLRRAADRRLQTTLTEVGEADARIWFRTFEGRVLDLLTARR